MLWQTDRLILKDQSTNLQTMGDKSLARSITRTLKLHNTAGTSTTCTHTHGWSDYKSAGLNAGVNVLKTDAPNSTSGGSFSAEGL